MPAIQPARLKKDTSALAEVYARPEHFMQALNDFFEFYADRVQRPGTTSSAATILPTFNLAAPVMRQLMVSIKPAAAQSWEYTLQLTQKLWSAGTLEHRLAAGALLGGLGAAHSEEIIARLNTWIQSGIDNLLLETLLRDTLSGLPPASLDRFFVVVEGWLADKEPAQQILGLRALSAITRLPQFQNIPRIFQLLSPFMHSLPPALRPYLLELVELLARRTPQETAHFLQQNLLLKSNPATGWLLRQVLPVFPPDLREQLKPLAKS